LVGAVNEATGSLFGVRNKVRTEGDAHLPIPAIENAEVAN
jgi:hypothetical protein